MEEAVAGIRAATGVSCISFYIVCLLRRQSMYKDEGA
jgi:hypothetical protein